MERGKKAAQAGSAAGQGQLQGQEMEVDHGEEQGATGPVKPERAGRQPSIPNGAQHQQGSVQTADTQLPLSLRL